MTGRIVATFNVGSSSIKLAAYGSAQSGGLGPRLLRAELAGLPDTPKLTATAGSGDRARAFLAGADISDLRLSVLAPQLVMAMEAALDQPLVAVGHRVVQGGRHNHASRTATPELIAELETLCPLAPDHQPHNLAAIRAVNAARPDLPQTLSFDTAFHRTQPRIAQMYALPRAMMDSGILRYGYHGLSYAHIARHLPEHFPAHRQQRTLALHLGSGSSLCAILNGRSIAASMGFSALSGIPMATRCGDIDPGLLLYLMSERHMSVDDVSQMLRKQSGLLGVSGISGDLRQLEAAGTAEAEEAIELFIYRTVRECGSHISALGGIDALVFTGGVGEHSWRARAGIAAGLEWAGIRIDTDANRQGATLLSPPGSPVSVFVLPADEESEIARDCLALL
ncbi:MAG: acetate/propionate family kinase [Hyphomonas sp.]|uniref:acetate/propionate family kinase n=1 Tax=Hyphomonas sp. TaxID=87 RepID=UPI001831A143|nr:acetate/propionate family kinase [Hyphomonas sp.]MBA3067932.1 acetate/propionate family kinase [Hyphomonas sp.]MBU3920776.1 acetate/propionate family kinase [Alphaproteobacteria bacterium]MBU4061269.1 acetate/propionate family kinase [Alphaproteobacteria bacterium]MBU4162522.1 acetate/propionate family kinase [Alphaproteobacteria bacterium]